MTQTHDEQRRLLDTIVNSSNSLMGIVNDVLDFSKIEAGKMDLIEAPIDLKEFLNDLAFFYKPLASSKSIQMLSDVDERIPDRLMCDGLRLRQVLTNLLSNALKFTKEGHVLLNTKVITITNSSVLIKFNVKDTGIGIDERHQEKLFKAFTQADESTTRQFGGTGLGLVISQSIIEKMESNISLVSKLGRGSTFSFSIDFKIPTEKELKNELDAQSQQIVKEKCLQGVRGLIADDSKVNRIAIEHQMKKLGCTFALVENGQQALEISTQQHFDFILMDVSMPVMDGLEATRQIRKIEKDSKQTSPTPIIAMTANAFSEQKEACLEAGMDDFLTKPAKLHQIAEKVLIALERSQNASKHSNRFEVSSASKLEGSEKGKKTAANNRLSHLEESHNFAFLDELESVYGSDIWESIIDEFLQEGESTFRKILEGFQNKDLATVSNYAHKFKGEIGIIGFKKLVTELEELQHTEKNSIDLPEVESLIKQVTLLYEALVSELNRRIAPLRN
ncbi:response regulator [Puniceicoccaceae bacterium K14]|nr:response regulator [Puniceicoccaceae bacterium K14]